MYFLCRTKIFQPVILVLVFRGDKNCVSVPETPFLHKYPTQPPFNHPNHVTGTSPGRGPVLQQFVHLRAVPFGTANLLPKLARFAANLCKPRIPGGSDPPRGRRKPYIPPLNSENYHRLNKLPDGMGDML